VATALEYLGKQQPIDLIFLDLNLPMGEPTDIIKYVKSVSCYAKTIITAVTASSDLKDVIAMQELGVKNYITKPLNFEKMNQIVKSIPEFYWLAVTPDQSAA
jgi:DNA-binding response OmpR family regulator